MMKDPPRPTLFPYHDALPIYTSQPAATGIPDLQRHADVPQGAAVARYARRRHGGGELRKGSGEPTCGNHLQIQIECRVLLERKTIQHAESKISLKYIEIDENV